MSILAKFLASKLLAKVAKALFITFLRLKAKQTENTVDDALVDAFEKALD